MDINSLLKGRNCECGKFHSCDIGFIAIEKDATRHLASLCDSYSNILIVADQNTYKAGGEKVEAVINNKISKRVIFSGETVLIPNETAIDEIKENLDGIDLIVGIGSGVIQDLCKFVSFYEKVPYYIVATAPSMDGYASTVAAMILGGMKISHITKVPDAIIADTEILKNAPLNMIKSGYGDVLGKISALNDWKLSNLLFGEELCEYVYNLTKEMLNATIPLAEKLLERDEESIKILTEALIGVGVAMAYNENSRPASGCEHHIAHFFELNGIRNNEPYFPHGTDVAYSTVISCAVRERLLKADFNVQQFIMFDTEYYRGIKDAYGEIAEECIELQRKANNYGKHRIPLYREKEKEIIEILKEVPTEKEAITLLEKIGLPMDDFYNNYKKETINKAVIFAKDLRDRFTALWMYYDVFGTKEV
ncbi:MAG: sn-glycerol-1-phosphate dehydrogenase [Ruminococcaceae bacterium]|nr:sn-glycerol-1-phosphate dehydrogenase [Oscillospiraceae bacterium]